MAGRASGPAAPGSGAVNIGIDATCWQLRRGFGRHTRCLLRALAGIDRHNHYTFITDVPAAVHEFPEGVEARVVATRVATTRAASATSHRSARDLLSMSRAMSQRHLDVVLFPTVYSYVPVMGKAKKLVIIHDVTSQTHPALSLGGRIPRALWRVKLWTALRQADVIITVSEFSRAGIVRELGIPAQRIEVIGEASDPIFRVIPGVRASPRLAALGIAGDARSIVFVGGFSPHKNLGMLVDTYARISRDERCADTRLILAGDHETDTFRSAYVELRHKVEALGLQHRVLFTGYLPDEDLVMLLNQATVLVLPSLQEGFGLPAIEAAACGCPVIATTASPLPDILGDACEYIDPRMPHSLRAALLRVLLSGDRRERMRRAGLQAARRHDWSRPARQLVDLMERVAGQ